MQFSKTLLCALGVFGSFLTGRALGQPAFAIGGRVIRECDDIPVFSTLEGELTFANHVECTVEDMKWITVTGDATIKTTDGGHMNMTNIEWLVEDIAHVTFIAPTVTIGRTEDLGSPLIFTYGTVEFRVDSWHESFQGGAPDDRTALTDVFSGGRVYSEKTVHYQHHSIVAADPRVGPESTETPGRASGAISHYTVGSKNPACTASGGCSSSPSSVDGASNAPSSGFVAGNVDSHEPRPPHSDARATSPSKDDSPVPQRRIRYDTPWARSRERLGSAYSRNDRPTDESVVIPPDMMKHPEPSVRVGHALTGRLMNADKTAALYVGRVDGSIRHARSTGLAPVDEEGKVVGAVPQEIMTLVAPDTKKILEMYRLRVEATAELDEGKAAEMGSKSKNRKGLGTILKRYLPFGKAGFRYRRKIERAKAHLKEVKLTVTDRGRLELTMDGMVVLQVSGPSLLGWRAKDSSYALQTTKTGFTVTRGEGVDWSVDA